MFLFLVVFEKVFVLEPSFWQRDAPQAATDHHVSYDSSPQAAKAGNLSYVKALLVQGQDPNDLDSTGQYTPIIAAAFLGHTEVHYSTLN